MTEPCLIEELATDAFFKYTLPHMATEGLLGCSMCSKDNQACGSCNYGEGANDENQSKASIFLPFNMNVVRMLVKHEHVLEKHYRIEFVGPENHALYNVTKGIDTDVMKKHLNQILINTKKSVVKSQSSKQDKYCMVPQMEMRW